MAQGLEQVMQLDEGQQQTLQQMDQKLGEMKLAQDESLAQFKTLAQRAVEGKEVKLEELEKAEQGLLIGEQFNKDMTSIAGGLTAEYSKYGQFIGDLSQYQGAEKAFAFLGLRKFADRAREKRVEKATVEVNLQTIVDYGHFMVGKLNNLILINEESRLTLEQLARDTSKRLEETQPKYEEARAKSEKIQKQLGELEGKLVVAGETEYASLIQQKTQLAQDYEAAKQVEDVYFTQVKSQKDIIGKQHVHSKAAAKRVTAVKVFKTALQENITNTTDILMQTPVSIQTTLALKAGEQYDKAQKSAVDIATETVLYNTQAALDITAKMMERPIMTGERYQKLKQWQNDMEMDSERRFAELRRQYEAPTPK